MRRTGRTDVAIEVAGSLQRQCKRISVRQWLVGAAAVVSVAAIFLLNMQPGRREKPDPPSAIMVRPGKPVALSRPTPVTTPNPEKPLPRPTSESRPNAEIVAHFIANDQGAPEGYVSETELHKRIMTQERDRNAAVVERALADHFRSFPSLDPALIQKGVTCVRTLCEVTGAFRSDASTANMGVGLHDLQNIEPRKLTELGVETALVSSFSFNPKTRRQEYLIFFSRL